MKPMHPSSSRAFQRHQEHDLKHLGSVDLITTKQKKTNHLPSWIDSVACVVGPSVTTFSTDFSFQNLVFWNLFEFSVVKII